MSKHHTRKLIIIGSGPAGYTAAIYAARGSLAPLVLAGPEPGGQLTTTTDVENYPGFPQGIKGPELIANMQKQAERFGAEIKFEIANKVDFSGDLKKIWTNEAEYQAKAVLVTTGARARTLQLPKEKDFWGRGVHTCATCDGFFYKDKVVAIIGGGDSAMEEGNFLTNFAKQVYLIHRGDKFRASKIMVERIKKNQKIKIIKNSEVKEILGKDKFSGLKIINNQTNQETDITVDGMFYAIGHIPNTEIFKGQLDLHESGYINARDYVYTNVEGVFAGGDCVDHIYRQAVTAAGLGCMAEIAAERWLQSQS